MDGCDNALSLLLEKGKKQGYLTYAEVADYLPDEDSNSEKLDALILALENLGIELCETAPESETAQVPSDELAKSESESEFDTTLANGKLPKVSDDPIRMYLSQMAEIPLLNRDEEIALAKRIEITRKRYRRAVMGCRYALDATLDTLKRVHQGELPFDRTIKVSLTERLTKEQIQARMPHHFRTMDHLLKVNKIEFAKLIRKSTSAEVKETARLKFLRTRAKLVQLIEELSLRSRRISPMIGELKKFSQRMSYLQSRLREDELSVSERSRLRSDLKRLVELCQESPVGLAKRVEKCERFF